MSATPEVSIVVVSYNTREMTLECLRSLVEETSRLSYEVLFIDNQSSDGSYEAVEAEFGNDARFRLKSATENRGFAMANNEMAQLAQGQFLLLLNPDTVVQNHAIDRLVSFAREHPNNGIWGGRTVFAAGSFNPSGCFGRYSLWALLCQSLGLSFLLKNHPIFDSRNYPDYGSHGVKEVSIIAGCFLLIHRDFWNMLGGLDEEFFMYAEDADLCMRASDLGGKLIVFGEATIIHHGRASEANREGRLVKLLKSELGLLQKHWSPPACWAAHRLIDFRVWSHAFLETRFSKKGQTWEEVWRRRAEWKLSSKRGQLR